MDGLTKLSFIRKIALFSELDERYISQINTQSSLVKYSKGDIVFNAGEAIRYIYFVKSGSVKVGISSDSDKMLIKEIVFENEIFGENLFTESTERRHIVEVLNDAEVLQVPASYFKSLLEMNPILCHELSKVYISKLSSLEDRMNNFVFKKAQNRIYLFLNNMANTKGIKIGFDEILIHHGLSHKEIANITDTSRQTVARVLSDLKKSDVIHFSARKPHKILIRDMAHLS
jgi:CRP-like cAMP-binding protein